MTFWLMENYIRRLYAETSWPEIDESALCCCVFGLGKEGNGREKQTPSEKWKGNEKEI